MKFNEVKDLSVTELKKKRATLSEELFQARIKNSIGQLSNPLEIRDLRRSIAKINTAIVKKVAR
ncbi:50S ribosomal protein L29 [Bdellovibrio bacteriovorus]|uniref:Large ribosomal subunit protein uL29 n=1 Tax=Bdellovibrio reynosensis TaxID=2835041 RepID=A0ABY4C8M1_9BACT|nr:50S ribosomal protein L29 [Bdellovibrio reynosensis]UOF01218.1 50S ribosomal protein L29 [Bdellovibrio reynosensis]